MKLLLLFIPLLLGFSKPPEQCWVWEPPTIRTDGTPMSTSQIANNIIKINGVVSKQLYPGKDYNKVCLWLEGRNCVQVKVLDLQGRDSKWWNGGCKG